MKFVPYLISHISILLLLSSCSKEKSIAESAYNNPPKDSVKFGYRVESLFFTDFDNKETSFEFSLEVSNAYAWKSILINYEKDHSTKKYTPYYDIAGYLTSLVQEESPALENIEMEYIQIPPSNVRLIAKLKYYRMNNPFALTFSYDSVNLRRIERRYLNRETGAVGGLIESHNFCSGINLGNCTDSIATSEYQHGAFFNNLYHSNELLPFILLLKSPQQSSLADIIADLPLYFSRYYPNSITRPILGTYEVGLNAKMEPTFFYFHKSNLGLVQGYNFSMR